MEIKKMEIEATRQEIEAKQRAFEIEAEAKHKAFEIEQIAKQKVDEMLFAERQKLAQEFERLKTKEKELNERTHELEVSELESEKPISSEEFVESIQSNNKESDDEFVSKFTSKYIKDISVENTELLEVNIQEEEINIDMDAKDIERARKLEQEAIKLRKLSEEQEARKLKLVQMYESQLEEVNELESETSIQEAKLAHFKALELKKSALQLDFEAQEIRDARERKFSEMVEKRKQSEELKNSTFTKMIEIMNISSTLADVNERKISEEREALRKKIYEDSLNDHISEQATREILVAHSEQNFNENFENLTKELDILRRKIK